MEIDWNKVKEVAGKAAFAGLYAAIAELALTQTADKNTLLIAAGAAALRGLAVFISELHNALKPTLEARLTSHRLADLL